jgi:GT2 family glycosyltransferase
MIPVLIVPILNQPELLLKLLTSIDHPIRKVVIIDNGDVVTYRPQMIMSHRNVIDYRVIAPGHNLGVAASWNLGMKVTPRVPWWLIVNHDLEFGPGDLARLDDCVDEYSDTHYFMNGMAAFALTQGTLSKVGYFDENFHPAYDEDLDWDRRAKLVGCQRVEVGFTGTHVGSATIHSDPELRAQNGRSHAANDVYYAHKWGGLKQGGEIFDSPFNEDGHIGDWRLDPERLRTQGWVKS